MPPAAEPLAIVHLPAHGQPSKLIIQLGEDVLAKLRELVGGDPEYVPGPQGTAVYCDEEFLYKEKYVPNPHYRHPNPNATVDGRGTLFGDLVVTREDSDGKTVSLTREDLARWGLT